MIPLYGFLEGDRVGILILRSEEERVADLAAKLQTAARMRVAPRDNMRVLHGGRELSPNSTVVQAGMQALDRFDVRGTR
jgi:hypothetical protein